MCESQVVVAYALSLVLAVPLCPRETDRRANEHRRDRTRKGRGQVDYDTGPYHFPEALQRKDLKKEYEERCLYETNRSEVNVFTDPEVLRAESVCAHSSIREALLTKSVEVIVAS